MMKQTGKVISLIMLCSVFSSCALMTPAVIKPPKQYALTDVPAVKRSATQTNSIVMVALPTAAPYYKTSQMAYLSKQHEVNYYTLHAWADMPTHMLQPLIVKTLQKTNRFRAIVTPPVTGSYDYMLTTQILQLRQNFVMQPASYEVTLRLQLFRMSTNRAIATREITVTEPSRGCDVYQTVLAANAAMSEALAKLAQFTIRKAR